MHCPYYEGEYVYKNGLCPNAEAILPRLVYTAITVGREASLRNAELWRKVVNKAEGQ